MCLLPRFLLFCISRRSRVAPLVDELLRDNIRLIHRLKRSERDLEEMVSRLRDVEHRCESLQAEIQTSDWKSIQLWAELQRAKLELAHICNKCKQLNAKNEKHIRLIVAALDRQDFLCPVTQQQIKDPVLLKCGHVFERMPCVEWRRLAHTCPVCRMKWDEF